MALTDDPEWREQLLSLAGADPETGEVLTTADLQAQYEYERVSSVGRSTRRARKGRTDTGRGRQHDARMYDELERQTWRFRCPTCGRDVQLSRRVLVVLLEGLAVRGVSQCDVSALPANLSSS